MSTNTNFDILLRAAAKECIAFEGAAYTDAELLFPITPELKRRADKIIKRAERKPCTVWRTLKYAAVACIICLAICFTACMCIPKLRNALKEAFVRWYEDYIAVGFASGESDEMTEPTGPAIGAEESRDASSDVTESVTDAPTDMSDEPPASPTKVEKKAQAAYLPESYVQRVKVNNSRCYSVSFYLEEEFVFSFKQTPIKEYLVWVDSTDKLVSRENVNGTDAVLTADEADPNKFTLVWQSDEYEFSLNGSFTSKEELLKIAEGIKTED